MRLTCPECGGFDIMSDSDLRGVCSCGFAWDNTPEDAEQSPLEGHPIDREAAKGCGFCYGRGLAGYQDYWEKPCPRCQRQHYPRPKGELDEVENVELY